MTRTYDIKGMSCDHCAARVKKALEAHRAVAGADVRREAGIATLSLDAEVTITELQAALSNAGDYRIIEQNTK